MNEDRQAAKRAYKERLETGGVYAIKNITNGKLLLQSTADMSGAKNRFDFSFKMGVCSIIKLREDWSAFGKEAFTMEVLEEIDRKADQSHDDYMDDVRLLEDMWREKLDPAMLY